MSKREDIYLLEDILEATKKILDFTKGMEFDEFFNDEKTKDAVARNFEIIGEASVRLSDKLKLNNKEIDWIRLRGFRNRIVHDYFGIDYTIIWSIIENNLNDLYSTINRLIQANK